METRTLATELSKQISGTWSYVDDFLKSPKYHVIRHKISVLTSCIVAFILGISVRGDWVLLAIGAYKGYVGGNSTIGESKPYFSWDYVKDYPYFLLGSAAVSYISYYVVCYALDYMYYIKRANEPDTWKCQPDKFLSQKDRNHAFWLGSFNLFTGSILSAFFASYIYNGGPSFVYFRISDYGWIYFFLSFPLLFIWQEAMAYHFHLLYHTPFLYKNFHKWHHRYHQPIAYTATAIHPVEFINYQCALASPMFLFPIHSGVYVVTMLYIYYYGMISHCGIDMDAFWPWEPEVMFHDLHHKHFHVNIGFNLKLFDWLYGTTYIPNLKYTETTYFHQKKEELKAE